MTNATLLDTVKTFVKQSLEAEGYVDCDDLKELVSTVAGYADWSDAEDEDIQELLRDNGELVVLMGRVDTIHIGAFPDTAMMDFTTDLIRVIFGVVAENLKLDANDRFYFEDVKPLADAVDEVELDNIIDHVLENY